MAAGQGPTAAVLYPDAFFTVDQSVSKLADQLHKTSLGGVRSTIARVKPMGQHSFSIVAQMLKDELLAPNHRLIDTESPYASTMKNLGGIVQDYASNWIVHTDEYSIREKIEELQWLSAIIFGLGGYREGHAFRSDFFL